VAIAGKALDAYLGTRARKGGALAPKMQALSVGKPQTSGA
jgi:hypothetical protein